MNDFQHRAEPVLVTVIEKLLLVGQCQQRFPSHTGDPGGQREGPAKVTEAGR